ncbi:Choline oxidase [Venturia nashicola]|uniref:Chromosome segregation in meiosis protein n=1 Tax=Venturia nashicola TaxID=86259 RepID=A0A4Z1P9Z0_9PEZI|nr:Choline oxidase [Venturia nashicola]
MARPGITEEVPRDDLDALFDVDSMDEMVDSNSAGNNTREPDRDGNGGHRRSEAQADEEIKITKKRQPVAKLDDTRLLADPGIPKLQRISKQRLKFRGKGHEFSDVAQLLRTYQLWLDDLFPRAKFADGLAMIEKLGHSKRMKVTRKTWIDESKPKASIEKEDAEHEPVPATSHPGPPANATGVIHREHNSAEASLRPSAEIHGFNATLQQRTTGAGPLAGSSVIDSGAPDDDELDDLLAEDPDLNMSLNGNLDERPPSQGSHRPGSKPVQSFEDDEEALREMDTW